MHDTVYAIPHETTPKKCINKHLRYSGIFQSQSQYISSILGNFRGKWILEMRMRQIIRLDQKGQS